MKSWLLALLILVSSLAPALGANVKGVVLTADGKPLAGAQVAVCQTCAGKNEVRLRTDKSGAFTANVIPCKTDASAGKMGYVYAYSRGYVPNWAEIKPGKVTIKLQPAGQLWGSVVDEKGLPVAGVKVAPQYVNLPGDSRLNIGCSPFRGELTSVTTADGRWCIIGLPLAGTASIGLWDERFAETSVMVTLGGDAVPTPPMIARPGASLAGRVVFENGKPAAGVHVYCNGHRGGGTGATTDAKGYYRLTSLNTGFFDVMASDKEDKYLGTALAGVKAVEGTTTRLPNLVLTVGALVKGRVLDAETGKPVPGVYVGAFGAHNPSTTGVLNGINTDSEGRYKLRVAPGETTISVYGERKGYLRDDMYEQSKLKVTAKKGQVVEYNIRIRKGIAVTGTAVDQGGKPVPEIGITIDVDLNEHGRRSIASSKTDSAGRFSIAPLKPGKGKITAVDDMDRDGQFFGEWEVVEPKEIDVPSGSPVKVTVRKISRIPLSGKVVTPAGLPVATASVAVEIFSPIDPDTGMGGPVIERTLVTNGEGRFNLMDLRPGFDIRFKSAEKQGYQRLSGGGVTATDTAYTISDIIMAPLDREIRGRVTDADGNPVAGAEVTSPVREFDDPVMTDEQGGFVLSSLPQGEVIVMAAYETSFGTATAAAEDTSIVIKLETPKEESSE